MRPKSRLEWAAVVAAFVGAFGLGFMTGWRATWPLFVASQQGAAKLEQRAVAAETERAEETKPSRRIAD